MKFIDFPFSDEVQAGIEAAEFVDCMPVQAEVFAATLEKPRDLLVQSQTGTGKTAAFLLPIFERMIREPDKKHKALVIAPTRELAAQIEDEAKMLAAELNIRIGCFFGGVGYGKQEQLLREGVDIVIGTPGRLIDFGQSKKLNFKDIDIVIIDEADRLFDMGFLPDLRKMMKQMVNPEERQTMLFSATLGTNVGRLAWEYMNGPKEIVIEAENITVDEISQHLYHVAADDKMQLLLGLLKKEQPRTALIFTNTKDYAVKVAKRLELNGFHAEYIMGDLPQRKRLSIIKGMKSGEIDILVATDVAARGLHINDLPLVVNYDIPEDPENYVHRIGRTARAGKSGKAISLVCERYVYGLDAIEEFLQAKIPVEWADEELLNFEDKSKGIRVDGIYDRNKISGSGRDYRKSSGSKKQGKTYSTSQQSKSWKPKPAGDKQTGERQPGGYRKSAVPGKGGPKSPLPKKAPPRQDIPRPSSKSDEQSRLEYYKKKYGEDFQFAGSTGKGGSKSSVKSAGGKSAEGKGKSPEQSKSPKKDSGKKKGLLKKMFGREK